MEELHPHVHTPRVEAGAPSSVLCSEKAPSPVECRSALAFEVGLLLKGGEPKIQPPTEESGSSCRSKRGIVMAGQGTIASRVEVKIQSHHPVHTEEGRRWSCLWLWIVIGCLLLLLRSLPVTTLSQATVASALPAAPEGGWLCWYNYPTLLLEPVSPSFLPFLLLSSLLYTWFSTLCHITTLSLTSTCLTPLSLGVVVCVNYNSRSVNRLKRRKPQEKESSIGFTHPLIKLR